MFLKRRIVLDKFGNALKFDIVLYPSKEDYNSSIDEFPDVGAIIGSTSSYEKAERLEILFNEICKG